VKRVSALSLTLVLAVSSNQALAQNGPVTLDNAAIALCKMAKESDESAELDLVLQFHPKTDERLTEGEIRFVDPNAILGDLYPQATLVSPSRMVVMFTKTKKLPVKSDNDLVTLSFGNTDDNSMNYNASLYTVGSGTGEDRYQYSGTCTIGKPRDSSNKEFARLQNQLAPSSPETVQ